MVMKKGCTNLSLSCTAACTISCAISRLISSLACQPRITRDGTGRGTVREASNRNVRIEIDGKWREPKAELAFVSLEIRSHGQRQAPPSGKHPLRRNLAHVQAQSLAPAVLEHRAAFDEDTAGAFVAEGTLGQGHVPYEKV